MRCAGGVEKESVLLCSGWSRCDERRGLGLPRTMERVASSKPVCVPRSKLARHSSFDTAEACADWSSESSATQLEACSSRTACDGGARAHAGRAAGVGRRACSVAFRRARRKRRRQLARHGGRDESDFFGAGAGHRRDHGVFWRSAVWLDSHPHNLFRRRRDPARGAQRRKPCAVHARNGLRSARHHVLDGRGHQVGPSGVFDALRHRRAGRARPDLRLGHQHALAAAHCAFVGDLAGDRWYCDGAAVLDGATHDRRGKVPSASDAAAASDRVWLHDVCALALRDRKPQHVVWPDFARDVAARRRGSRDGRRWLFSRCSRGNPLARNARAKTGARAEHVDRRATAGRSPGHIPHASSRDGVSALLFTRIERRFERHRSVLRHVCRVRRKDRHHRHARVGASVGRRRHLLWSVVLGPTRDGDCGHQNHAARAHKRLLRGARDGDDGARGVRARPSGLHHAHAHRLHSRARSSLRRARRGRSARAAEHRDELGNHSARLRARHRRHLQPHQKVFTLNVV
mmetsp:Transcript_11324/g.30505  ORF Transcript_11324/g.30505 Transcript_11324/m.30505 type:complete len:517 (+) Transcript_11324:170-1720(+)